MCLGTSGDAYRRFTQAALALLLGNGAVVKKTIVFGEEVAGHIVCFEQSGRQLVGYWVGREFWGKGLATNLVATVCQQLLSEYDFIGLHVDAENPAARTAYERVGMTVIGGCQLLLRN